MLNRTNAVVISLIGLFGMIVIGVVIHEELHKKDFKMINKTKDYTCYLVGLEQNQSFWNYAIGYYEFTPETKNDSIMADEIGFKSEFKAYSVDFLLLGIYMILVVKLFFDVKRAEKRISDYG